MNANPTRVGQINLAGDEKALFLKMFAGEVLAAFAEKNKFLARHMVRTISSGKSAQFPATGKTSAAYHVPGAEILGTPIPNAERVIEIDGLLIADTFIPNIDEAMSHFDVRSEYSTQLGAALAREFDKHVAQVMILAARASATVTGLSGGTVVTDADAHTNADSLVGSIFDAAEALDAKDVPEEDRFAFLKPEQYYLLVNSAAKAIHSDYNRMDNGSLATGKVFRIAGIELVKTNNVPSTNVTVGPSTYQGNFTTVVSVVAQRSAVGTVKLLDLALETDYEVRRQGTLMVAKYAMGHGILRPESSVEIKTS
jgi:hypothetical protein